MNDRTVYRLAKQRMATHNIGYELAADCIRSEYSKAISRVMYQTGLSRDAAEALAVKLGARTVMFSSRDELIAAI